MNALFSNLLFFSCNFMPKRLFEAFYGGKIERKSLFCEFMRFSLNRPVFAPFFIKRIFSLALRKERLTFPFSCVILEKIRSWENYMSFYEMAAEKEGHFFMAHGCVAMQPHFHGAPEFIFVQSGEQEVIVGGEKRILHAGEGCFCQPFCIHSYAESPSAVCFAIVGDGKYFERSFSSLGDLIPPRFFTFSDFELLSFLYHRFKQKTENNGGRVALNEGIAAFLVHALAQNTPFEPRKNDKQNLLVCDVLSYAHEHLEEDLSLGNLAKTFGYSNRHLSRILTRNLSQKWKHFIRR